MSSRREVISGLVGLGVCASVAGGLGFYMIRSDIDEARRMQNDKLGTTFSDPSPQGWQFAYLPRFLEDKFVADSSNNGIIVNSNEPIRLSKTSASRVTDVSIFVKENINYSPYYKAVGLRVKYPDSNIRDVFLREEPTNEINNQLIQFVNKSLGVEIYVTIEPVYSRSDGVTRAYFVITPQKLKS